jgi:hypothetical protein
VGGAGGDAVEEAADDEAVGAGADDEGAVGGAGGAGELGPGACPEVGSIGGGCGELEVEPVPGEAVAAAERQQLAVPDLVDGEPGQRGARRRVGRPRTGGGRRRDPPP